MPVATTQIRSERVAKPLKGTSSKVATVESPTKSKPVKSLQQVTPEETSEWLADLNNPSMRKYRFDSPEDLFEYPFKDADPVWIRTQEGKWMAGEVSGQAIRIGRTRASKRGRFYPVKFGQRRNIRKYFAPGNGEIKPNTPDVRELLWEEGLIDLNASDMPYDECSDGSTYMD